MKPREVVTRSIGGFEVSTTKLRPRAALKLAPKVLKILNPALPLALGGGRLLLQDIEAAGAAIEKLVEALTEDAIDTLCRELLCDTSITLPNEHGVMAVFEFNTPEMIDMAFGGLDNGMTLLVQTLIFVGEVNFKRSFFDLVQAAGLKAKAKNKTAEPVAPPPRVKLPPDLEPLYPALRLVTSQIVSMTELDCMSLDEVDDLNITLDAEAAARTAWRKDHPHEGR